MEKILVVEDDIDLSFVIKVYLTQAGYEADTAVRSDEALELVEKNEYDLILLDILLPDIDGRIICQKLRGDLFCPIIFISCMDDEDTICEAFAMGGDDYIVKPIRRKDLLARVEANIRRAKSYSKRFLAGAPVKTEYRRFAVNTAHHELCFNGEIVPLSPIEYEILMLFIENTDKLLEYDYIYKNIWQKDSLGDYRTVMVHVSNLRKKLGGDTCEIISTVRGAGYIFTDK